MTNATAIAELETKIFELTAQLQTLRKTAEGEPVTDYAFTTLDGETRLSALFGDHQQLLVIHNMGQGCRYCTLWADGFNGLLPHLESAMSVVLVSKDPPDVQRRFANERGWRFRLASHGGGAYLSEQAVSQQAENMPGAVVYEKSGDKVLRKSSCIFGPGDMYCSMWSLLALAGLGADEWTPQFNYWSRPTTLDDGGANVLD